MPKKTKTSETTPDAVVVASQTPVVAAAVAEVAAPDAPKVKKPRAKKVKKDDPAAAAVVVGETPIVVDAVAVDEGADIPEKPKKKKAVRKVKVVVADTVQESGDAQDSTGTTETNTNEKPTKSTVLSDIEAHIQSQEEELKSAKANGSRDAQRVLNLNLKFLRSHRAKLRRVFKVKRTVLSSSKSGLMMPVKISGELCQFLNLPTGSEVARTTVTSEISKYVKKHNLQNTEKKAYIIPDAALIKLFRWDPSTSDPLTFTTLQSFLTHHYPPSQRALKLKQQQQEEQAAAVAN